VGEAPDTREGGGPSESPVAGVFFLICGLVTGGFPFSGGCVSARDSGWHPSFFGGPGFLPLGAMVMEGRDVPQGGGGRTSGDQRKGEGLLCYIKLYQELKVNYI